MNGDLEDAGETVESLGKESDRYRMEHALCHDLLNETLSLGHSISSDDLLSVESKSCGSDNGDDYLNSALSDGQSISSDDLLSEGSDIVDDFSFPIIETGSADEKDFDGTNSQGPLQDRNCGRNDPFEGLETIMEEGETDEEKEEFKRQKEKYFKLKKHLESMSTSTKQKRDSIDNHVEKNHNGTQARTKKCSEFYSHQIDNTCSYDGGDEHEYDEQISSCTHQNGEMLNKNMRQDLTNVSTENQSKMVDVGTEFCSSKPVRECVVKLEETMDKTFCNGATVLLKRKTMDEDHNDIIGALRNCSSEGNLQRQENEEKEKQGEFGIFTEGDCLEQRTSQIEPIRKDDSDSHIGHHRECLQHEEGSPHFQMSANVKTASCTKLSSSFLERQVEDDDEMRASSVLQESDSKWRFLDTLWLGIYSYRIISRDRGISNDESLEEGLLTNCERDENPTLLNDPEYLPKWIVFALLFLFVMMLVYFIL